ncbi:hypothetical protein B566_EDAN001801 [Ephemera danica]|nr:hypothetical protein B566_EDAN001801 [Ephemera danica]
MQLGIKGLKSGSIVVKSAKRKRWRQWQLGSQVQGVTDVRHGAVCIIISLYLYHHLIMVAVLSMFLLLLSTLLVAIYIYVKVQQRKKKTEDCVVERLKSPPGPRAWPIIGNLHLLGQFETPFHAFTALAEKFGPIYQMQLGSSTCIIVNNYALIKEVLITKGAHFGGRPDFIRFHHLFGGDRNNSLALCDWSDLQKTRRRIARLYCSPRTVSAHFAALDGVAGSECGHLLSALAIHEGKPFLVKPLIMAACANMFTTYMCSTRFDYEDAIFRKVVQNFDEIFWDINQGYAVDFMPWLAFAYQKHMKKLNRWAVDIRQFIMTNIIEKHRQNLQNGAEGKDFTDALLLHLENEPDLTWEHALFELEDFIGGHSAVGNSVMLTLAAIVKNPEVARKIQAEVDSVTAGTRAVSLFDRAVMPYTEATVLEVLRVTSSPIVPHVATQESSIGGYAVENGTMIFLNNFELNTGKAYWEEPEKFKPERFVTNGTVTKPAHFIPFSTGKRTCIGSRLVTACNFAVVSSILQNYDVTAGEGNIELPKACVALPPDTFSLVFTPRKHNTPSDSSTRAL